MKIEVNDNILSLIDKTPDSFISGIAERVKQRRLEKRMDAKDACCKSWGLAAVLQAV